jgi:DNA end-binding protein Ku
MHGRGHQVGIKAHGQGLMISILRYGNEVRPAESYFQGITAQPKPDAVALAAELIKRMSGRFEPEKMPDEYVRAVQELVRAKVEHRAPEVTIAPDAKPMAPVINIMDALKQSMQKQGQAKVRDAIRKRMGKAEPKEEAPRRATRSRAGARRSLRWSVLASFLFDHRDTDLPLMLSIARLVAKIKNASCKAKPFRAFLKRPDVISFRQQVH